MREASHAAARASNRGGVPNAVFVAAAADELPGALAGRVDLITISLPWASLLRELLGASPVLLTRLRATLTTTGELELLLSAAPSDGLGATLDAQGAARLAAAYTELGFEPVEVRPATAADVARLSSGWGRRLGIPDRRAAWLLRFTVAAPARGPATPPPRVPPARAP